MQHRPHSSRLGFIRPAIVSMIVGAAATVAIAWGCALWSPTRATIDPFPNPAGVADTVDPDGDVGLHGRERGFGWEYTSLRGERFTTNGKEDVIWAGPYGGVYHRVVGWPLSALRSRVEVLDSQAANRFSEGEPEPQVVLQQRRRWELPAREIFYRGIATKDLPGWTRAYSDRRLALVPMPLGFAIDTLLYGVAFSLLASISRIASRRLWPAPRGFTVITEGAA